jgi:hypothetical protein
MHRRLGLSLLFGIVVAAGLAAQAPATIITVRPDGTGDYPTIQIALEHAVSGDVIRLTNGTFTGEGNRDLYLADIPVTIESQSGDPAFCVIDCQGSAGAQHRGITLDEMAAGSYLRGITIKNGYVTGANSGGALFAANCFTHVENCIFWNNFAEYDGGAVFITNGSDMEFTGCYFAGNRNFDQYDGRGGVLCVTNLSGVIVQECAFNGNSGFNGACIHLDASSMYMDQTTINGTTHDTAIVIGDYATAYLDHSLVTFGTHHALYWLEHGDAEMECCDFYGNAGGDWVGGLAPWLGQYGNICADPLYCGVVVPLGLHENSPCAPEQSACGLIGRYPVSCGITTYNVEADGSGEYPTIQAAIDAAAEGGIVELGDGTYRGPGNRDLDLFCKSITVRSASDNPAACIIDCQGSSGAPHRAIEMPEGPWCSEPTIAGITIRNGYASYGGAIRLGAHNHLTIRNCRFQDNHGAQVGGAIHSNDSKLKVLDSVFQGNSSDHEGGAIATINFITELSLGGCQFLMNTARTGGALYKVEGVDSIGACVFVQNCATAGSGGAAYIRFGINRLYQCVFTGNESAGGDGGAVHGSGYAAIVAMEDCVFQDNTTDARGGGIYCSWVRTDLDNCLLHGNSAAQGGGVGLEWTDLGATGCTFSDNTASTCGGALYGYPPKFYYAGSITNCTLYHNSSPAGAGIYMEDDANGIVWPISNTIIASNYPGCAIEYIGPQTAIPELTCCDLYGNSGGDWTGVFAGQYGINGNISADPLLCGSQNPEQPHTLDANSPCAAENNPECGQIGAWPIGCGEVSAVEEPRVLAGDGLLGRLSPNPFRGSTVVTYQVPASVKAARINLNVFDAGGRLVRTLVDAEQPAGVYSIAWDGRSRAGKRVAAGIYFCRLGLAGRCQTRPLILVE